MTERFISGSEKVKIVPLSEIDVGKFADRAGGLITSCGVNELGEYFKIHLNFKNLQNKTLGPTTEFIANGGELIIIREKFNGNPDSFRTNASGFLIVEVAKESLRRMEIGFPVEIRQYKRESGDYDTFFVLPKTTENSTKLDCYWISPVTGIRGITGAEIDEKKITNPGFRRT